MPRLSDVLVGDKSLKSAVDAGSAYRMSYSNII